MRPGQQWQYSLGGATTNVQVNLTTRMGGCWEITACATNDGAGIGTTYGCKGIPKTCKGTGECTCNGAWLFNPGNKSITSVMSGKCLEAKGAAGAGSAVEVSSCTGKPNQQWHWKAGGTAADDDGGKITSQISSLAQPGLCIDDGDFPPQLYDVVADPGEHTNVAAANEDVVTRLLGRLDFYLSQRCGPASSCPCYGGLPTASSSASCPPCTGKNDSHVGHVVGPWC